jgi:hypothetical protein
LQIMARAGESFFYAMAAMQLATVLLVAPAAASNVFGHDRAQRVFAQRCTT